MYHLRLTIYAKFSKGFTAPLAKI